MNVPGFKLGRLYADGQYCKGYHALDLINQKTVNLQIFDPALPTSPTFVEQFREVTTKLVGANFGIMVPILWAEMSDQACYVSSEYFPGSRLSSSTPRDLTRGQVLHLVQQLAQTLDQLHQAGLVHGGIEYGSLFLRAPYQIVLKPVILQRVIPMLSSMSLASMDGEQRCYLAPEAGEELTPATDFYALGVLVHQLLFHTADVDTHNPGPPAKWSCEGENKDLEPLFRQLVETDSGHRIQSLDQFNSVLRQCGVELTGSLPYIGKSIERQQQRTVTRERSARLFSKIPLTLAGLAGVALATTLVLPLPDEVTRESTDPAANSASGGTRIEADPDEQTPAFTQEPPAKALADINGLYQQALNQVEVDPEAALPYLDTILSQQPGNREALNLMRRAKKEISVRAIVEAAERQLQENKLLAPAGDNAYESYQALAVELSADDQRVIGGFTHIAASYQSLAESQLEQKHLDTAQKYLELGLSVRADYPPLLDLRIRIDAQIKAMEQSERRQQLTQRQQRQEQSKVAETERLTLQRLQQKQRKDAENERQLSELNRLLEQKRETEFPSQAATDPEHKNETGNQIAEQRFSQQLAERARRDKADALLKAAKDYLNNGKLSLDSVLNAHRDYDELRELDNSIPQLDQLKNELIDAYSILALRHNSDDLYQSALQALEHGVQLSPQERKKLQIRSQLSR